MGMWDLYARAQWRGERVGSILVRRSWLVLLGVVEEEI